MLARDPAYRFINTRIFGIQESGTLVRLLIFHPLFLRLTGVRE
jgi:hypothetical protein